MKPATPTIPHAPLSLEREEYRLQSRINLLALKIIRNRIIPKDRYYYIHQNQLLILK